MTEEFNQYIKPKVQNVLRHVTPEERFEIEKLLDLVTDYTFKWSHSVMNRNTMVMKTELYFPDWNFMRIVHMQKRGKTVVKICFGQRQAHDVVYMKGEFFVTYEPKNGKFDFDEYLITNQKLITKMKKFFHINISDKVFIKMVCTIGRFDTNLDLSTN